MTNKMSHSNYTVVNNNNQALIYDYIKKYVYFAVKASFGIHSLLKVARILMVMSFRVCLSRFIHIYEVIDEYRRTGMAE
jgi:deoxyribose-phosphate aldolase